jgi:UDPglucose--hexose-1-phosphate uridylyltransferase
MRLEQLIPNVAYNVILHTGPFDSHRYDYYHWHIEVIPRIATVAGLEWGSGIHINVVPPEVAADRLSRIG